MRIEKRCSQCNRLLMVDNNVRTSDGINYYFDGNIDVVCKCKTLNKF